MLYTKKKLTVIIPIYNVEKYIRKCLLSISCQLVSDVEVILVNDGTPDSSIQQIEDIIDKYDCITLINQENRGLSEARNRGLQKASGGYIWFVDSDDTIEPGAFEEMLALIETGKDAYVFNIREIDEKTLESNIPKNVPHLYRSYSDPKSYILEHGYITPIQRFVFKREFLLSNNLFFVKGIYHEDQELVFRVFKKLNTLSVVDRNFYNYLLRSGSSITSSFSTKRVDSLLFNIESVHNIVREKDTTRKYREYLQYRIDIYYLYILRILIGIDDGAIISDTLKRITGHSGNKYLRDLTSTYRYYTVNQIAMLLIAHYSIGLTFKMMKWRYRIRHI